MVEFGESPPVLLRIDEQNRYGASDTSWQRVSGIRRSFMTPSRFTSIWVRQSQGIANSPFVVGEVVFPGGLERDWNQFVVLYSESYRIILWVSHS